MLPEDLVSAEDADEMRLSKSMDRIYQRTLRWRNSRCIGSKEVKITRLNVWTDSKGG